MQKTAADPLIGSLLEGRYRIRAWLAVGGMSTVYAALDERLDREVAVKVMAPSLSTDPVFLDRFAREARTAARLSHVNVVAVYDQGSDAGQVFLVMELVRGRTLRDLLRERGHVSPAEAVSLLEPMLAALASAHRAGLVHRDVKPENILLSDDGVVKVADFGLARAVAGDAANTGLMMGTVAYSAPEQFRRGTVDARSDVYSAGIVAFELLTGRQPHVGPDAMSVAYNHVHSDVPLPSSLQPGIAAALDQLVRRVTARDPQFRPRDAGAFLAEIHDLRRELRLPILPVPRRLRPAPGPRPAPDQPTSSSAHRWYPPGAAAAAGQGAALRTGATVPHPRTAGGPMSTPVHSPSAPTRPGHDATTVYDGGGFRPGSVDGLQHTLISPVHAGAPEHGSATAVPTAGPTRRRRRWLRTLVGALVLLLVCAGLIAGSWWYAAGRWSSVPNVHDQPVQQAQDLLQRQGFKVVTDPAQADDVVNRGNAITTRPDTGTRLVHGQTVHIIVSAGPTYYAVPDLHDKSKRTAVTTMAAFDDRGVTVTYSQTSDDAVDKGDVVRTEPSTGTKVRRGDTITVYVSTGPPIVELPDETGQTFDDAAKALAKLGFTVNRSDDFSDDVDSGTVISQDPNGSTQQQKFTAVTLTVSKGPDLVSVPTLPHFDPLDDAKAQLTAAGLKWEIKNYLGGVNGLVLQMDHDPGEQLKRGSTITLTVI